MEVHIIFTDTPDGVSIEVAGNEQITPEQLRAPTPGTAMSAAIGTYHMLREQGLIGEEVNQFKQGGFHERN
jgi:hypothetical protein